MNDDEFLAASIAANEVLSTIDPKHYRQAKLPSLIDDELRKVVALYLRMTSLQRETFSSSLLKNACNNLVEFAERMAMLGVRANSKTAVFDGLVSLVMVNHTVDLDHAEVMTLSLLHNSAVKLNAAEALMEQASTYAPNSVSRMLILNFLKRVPEDKRIEAMGFHEVQGPNGLIYKFGKQPIPAGLL